MTQTLETALVQIGVVLAAVPGVEAVQVNPPETVNLDMFILLFAESGHTDNAALGMEENFHDIAVYLMHRRISLPDDIAALRPLLEPVMLALVNESTPAGTMFAGSLTTFESIDYKFEFLEYAGADYVVYHIVMHGVKLLV